VTEYYLRMQYGDAVEVRYIDMADPASQAEFSELMTVAEEQKLPYPLVAINGHVRAAGSAHYYHVLPYVEQVLQARRTEPEGGTHKG
jgi:disulfide oxidoreductase YuzD